jgi:hypothetical protein
MTIAIITDADRQRANAYETSIQKDCALIHLKAMFDCLWKRVETAHIEREFLEYLEEYELYDIDRARDIIASEEP